MEIRGEEMGSDRETLDPLYLPRRKLLPTRSADPDQLPAVRSDSDTAPIEPAPPSVRYRECQRNHAAAKGGHVVDGCGEFMSSAEDALKCAACECHRNFHRKEVDGQSHYPSAARRDTITIIPPAPAPALNPATAPYPTHFPHRFAAAPVMMAFGGPAESSSEDLNRFQLGNSSFGGGQGSGSRKRFRTKFSQEQKEKMLEFAEKVGWKIQKQDEQQVHRFCDEHGLKRQVLKVWMHNNKPTTNKKP